MVIKLRYKSIGLILLMLFCMTTLLVSKINTESEIDAISLSNNTICLPIIMYHQVKPYKLGENAISPYEFESDLKYLSKNNYTTITMTQLIDYEYNNKALPLKPIILSFDDGYLNNYVYVFPLLKKYNMKMVFSIVGKSTDDFTNIPSTNLNYSHVTWNQLKEMTDSGYVEVQNHTNNLHITSNGRIGCMQKSNESLPHYVQVMIDDIGKLQEKITLMTGKTPNTFAYPYGRASKNTDPILKKLGFKASFSCNYGVNLISKNAEELFDLKRINRSHGQSIEKIITEAMKTL